LYIYDKRIRIPNSTCVKKRTNTEFLSRTATLNIINCVIIFYFLLRTKHVYTFMLLGSILLFELFHAFFSHNSIHSSIQTNTIHVITYFINFCFNGILQFQKTLPSNSFMCILLLLILFDIFALINLSLIFLYIIADVYIHIAIDLLLSATTKELYG
jgi:hypothetical protein